MIPVPVGTGLSLLMICSEKPSGRSGEPECMSKTGPDGTLIPEAQHVVMDQRGSGFDAYCRDKITGDARELLFHVGVKICDEHRAEWNAVQLTDSERPTVGAVLDVLCHMGVH